MRFLIKKNYHDIADIFREDFLEKYDNYEELNTLSHMSWARTILTGHTVSLPKPYIFKNNENKTKITISPVMNKLDKILFGLIGKDPEHSEINMIDEFYFNLNDDEKNDFDKIVINLHK